MIRFKYITMGALEDITTIKECLRVGGIVYLKEHLSRTVWELKTFDEFLHWLEKDETNVYFQRMIWPLDNKMVSHAGSLL